MLDFHIRLHELLVLLESGVKRDGFLGRWGFAEWFWFGRRRDKVIQHMCRLLHSNQDLDASLPDDPIRTVSSEFWERRLGSSKSGSGQRIGQARNI